MISLVNRRRAQIALMVGLVIVSWCTVVVLDVVYYDTSFLSGWTLLALMLLLSALNARKKLSFLPVGSSASWLQFHIHAGFFTVVLFGMHIGWRLPTGILETWMAVLFFVVALSGIVGLVLSRTLPARMTTRGETILFDRIPAHIKQLREESEAIVIQSASETNSRTVADFYVARIAWFFERTRHGMLHLFESDRPLRLMLEEVVALERYATAREIEFLEDIVARVRAKSDLDYQYSLQALLKGWLFVHIPLTYGLLLLAALHVVVVYAFDGGL